MDLLDTDLNLLDRDIPSKHFVCLQDVSKTSKCLLGMSVSNKSKSISNKSISRKSKSASNKSISHKSISEKPKANPKCIN